MEAIVKKWEVYSLIWISDKKWELELAEKKWDKVIIDFNITDIQRASINYWISFDFIDWEIILSDNTVYLESIKSEKTSEIKKEYNTIILEKYSYTDQINMSAEIQEIHLVARLEQREFTDAEMLKVWEATSMKYWIDEKKTECNEKILAL